MKKTNNSPVQTSQKCKKRFNFKKFMISLILMAVFVGTYSMWTFAGIVIPSSDGSSTVTINTQTSSTYTLTLPPDDGDNNEMLITDGNGGLDWAAQSGGSAPSLAFSNAAGPISIYPPFAMEVTVASVTQSVTAGNEIKIDYALTCDFTVSANWSVTFELRLYRNATLINTMTIEHTASSAGTQTIPISNTYVDTAPATSAASTYSIRVILTSATNITSAATGSSINLNLVTFP